MANVSVVTDKLGAATLNENRAQIGHVPLAEKKKKETTIDATVGTKVTIATNVRKITIEKNQPIYKYAVQIVYVYRKENGLEVNRELSKSVAKGEQHEQNKKLCSRVYKMVVQQTPALQKGNGFYYDRQACLYALNRLPNDELSASVTGQKISKNEQFIRADFKLTKVAESFQTTSNDIQKTVNIRPAEADRTILEALNQIISGGPLDNTNVLTIGSCVHYLYNDSDIKIRRVQGAGGKSSAVGASKAIKTLEGTDRTPNLFMTTELKTTLFHPDNASLLQVFRDYNGFNEQLKSNSSFAIKMKHAFTGLWCFLNYGKSHDYGDERMMIQIKGFGLSAREQKFQVDGKDTNVFDYFKKKYNMVLKYPDLFTIEARGRDGKNQNIPVECLDLVNSQTVKTEQMVGSEQADLIKLAAAQPQDRKNITDTVVHSIGLAPDGKGFIKVSEPEKVIGIVLNKPDIVFGGNRKVNWNDPKKRGPATDFMPTGPFHEAEKLTNWEVVFDRSDPFKDVIPLLTSTMKVSGMQVAEPDVSFISGGNLRPIFENAKAKNRQMLLFITKSINNYHQEMKALEQEYDVLTQEVRFETAAKLAQQQNTKKNIVNKINMKLGGLNYEIKSPGFSKPERLIIGFETSQKGGLGDAPIAIGYAANTMDHHQKFSGGYVYVKRSSDVYGPIIADILKKIFAEVLKNRPLKRPAELLIYFSGVTEGQYSLINEVYVNEIKKACLEINPNFKPHITVIAASKLHNTRLYKSDNNGRVSNLEPGTVIDNTIVSPILNEWYHTGAVARQGTNKACKFTLIFTTQRDETLSSLERITNDLCYDHQIVFHPISLPVPLFVAGESSKRGSDLLALRKPVYTNGEFDMVKTNEKLGYYGKKLFGTRFNA